MSEIVRSLGELKFRSLHKERVATGGRLVSDKDWDYYNSSLKHYEQTFASFLQGRGMESLLEGKADPVVIDIMAPTGTIRELFDRLPQGPKTGIAVSLEDLRSPEQVEIDASLGIIQVTENLLNSKVWKRIQTKLDGRKADLIIERGFGGLYRLPEHPVFFAIALQRMWSMLAEDGTMLLQLPNSFLLKGIGMRVDVLAGTLEKAGIDVFHDDKAASTHVLALKRSSESPAVLPLASLPLYPRFKDKIENQLNIKQEESIIKTNLLGVSHRKEPIPFTDLEITERERAKVINVSNSNSIPGRKELLNFENPEP
jgi:hypothetical protein